MYCALFILPFVRVLCQMNDPLLNARMDFLVSISPLTCMGDLILYLVIHAYCFALMVIVSFLIVQWVDISAVRFRVCLEFISRYLLA